MAHRLWRTHERDIPQDAQKGRPRCSSLVQRKEHIAYGLWLGVRVRAAETKNRLLFPTDGAFSEPSAIRASLLLYAIRYQLRPPTRYVSRLTFHLSRFLLDQPLASSHFLAAAMDSCSRGSVPVS